MALKWHDIIARAALRVNALEGVQSATLNATFNERPLTQTEFKSAVFPFAAHVHAVVGAAGMLAEAIASTSEHPGRARLSDVTGAVTGSQAAGAILPVVSESGEPIIGLLGAVREVVESQPGRPLTREPLQRVLMLIENANAYYKQRYYKYAIRGQRMWHTRAEAVIDCCVWNEATQLANATDNTGAPPFADSLGDALMCGALKHLMRDDEFAGQAQVYGGYFDTVVGLLRSGEAVVAAFAGPAQPMKTEG